MKIVHLCLSGPYNDNWGYQENIIPKYNRKDGHDVTVITSVFINSKKYVGYEKVNPGEYLLKDGVKIIRIPFKKNRLKIISEKLRMYEGVYKALKKEKPDFIFMHGLQFWDIKKVIKYIKEHPECKLVADNHATYDNSAKNFFSKHILHKIIWRFNIKKSLKYINKIFVLAPGCRKFAKEMYDIPDEKMEYLFLGADTDKIDFEHKEELKKEIRRRLNINESDFVLITGGKLSKGKNINLLLEAFKDINQQNLKLIIFGAFSDDIKQKSLEKIKYDNRVIYIGWLKGEEVYK